MTKVNHFYNGTPESAAKNKNLNSNRRSTASGPTLDKHLDSVIVETATGLNDKRPKLLKTIADPAVQATIVEHRDRLVRFGVGMVSNAAGSRRFLHRLKPRRPGAGHDRNPDLLLPTAVRSQARRQQGK